MSSLLGCMLVIGVSFLGCADVNAISLTCKQFRQNLSRCPDRKFWQETKSRASKCCLKALTRFLYSEEIGVAFECIQKRLDHMPFWQLTGFLAAFPALMSLTPRSMCKTFRVVLRVTKVRSPVLHLPSLLLLSSLVPAMFWKTWREYILAKLFIIEPKLFYMYPNTSLRYVVMYFRERGLPVADMLPGMLADIFSQAARLDDVVRRFSRSGDEGLVKGRDIAYIFHSFDVDQNCHLPFSCTDFKIRGGDCDHAYEHYLMSPTRSIDENQDVI